MVKKIELKVEKREKTEKPKVLRANGYIPAVLYGQGEEAISLKIKNNDFSKAFGEAGESALIDLALKGGDTTKAIIKKVQESPVKNKVTHVDIYKIDMKQPIETEIPIHFEGSARAETDLGGILMKNMETIHVKCLPGDLIEYFSVDLSKIETFDDVISVADLKVDEKVEILTSPETNIASVIPPRADSEEEEKSEETVSDESEDKKTGDEKQEGKEEDKKQE